MTTLLQGTNMVVAILLQGIGEFDQYEIILQKYNNITNMHAEHCMVFNSLSWQLLINTCFLPSIISTFVISTVD